MPLHICSATSANKVLYFYDTHNVVIQSSQSKSVSLKKFKGLPEIDKER